ncbi:unnamed protein product [Blepharisma stoltei]|uniref:Uncharacterized protein n=1 Tax=Blepharisma stoltei TaxID=1481888 RepID=A0AAU9IRA1_9CILI|nr:unnamed protein product [Blepharisma stoltei]
MEEFQCELCQSFPNSPVILSCCLKSVCKEHVSDQCPFCGISICEEEIIPNRILQSLLHKDLKTCERCENKPSTVLCKQCVAYLCKDCSAHLHSLGVYRRHIVTAANNYDAGKSEEKCQEHGLSFSHICTDEWKAICDRCLSMHEDHAVLAFDEVIDDALNEIQIKQEKIEAKSREIKQGIIRVKESLDGIENNANQVKLQVTQAFNSMKQMLKWKEEEIISELETAKERKINQLNFSKESLEKGIKKLQTIAQFITATKNQSATTIFTSLSYLSHIIEQALENDESQELTINSDFDCKINVQPLQAALEKVCFRDENSSRVPSPKGSMNSFSKSPRQRVSDITNKSTLLKKNEQNCLKDKDLMNFYDEKQASTPRIRNCTPTHIRDNSSCQFQSLDENPLERRVFIKKLQTASAIQVSWSHPPKGSPDLQYCLEYGVGTKIQNIEQFRQVYKGPAHTCIITDLLPKTSYRFRVSPSLASTDEKGDWSEVVTIGTHDAQKIDASTLGTHATMIARGSEKWIQFDRAGIVLCQNPYPFGKHVWEVKILNNALFSNDSQSSFKIGVASQKGRQVYGCPINYQAARGTCKIKVVLDMEAGTLTFFSPFSPQGEIFSSLPEGPLYPAFQNKPSKTSAASLKFMASFDCKITDTDLNFNQ